MSDKDNKDIEVESRQKEKVDADHKPGEGPRSLQNWQNMAKVRESLAADSKNREQYELDPIAYMQRFGVDPGSMQVSGAGGGEVSNLEGVDPQAEGPDVQLAFCKVWGVTVVVGGVVANAGANANALANANAGANINVGANLNVNVNGVGPAYEE